MAVEWGNPFTCFYTPKVGELKQKCYIIPEPRAELFYFPGTGNRLHAAFTQSSQNLRKRLRDSILSPFFHSYIFAMYKNEALWI